MKRLSLLALLFLGSCTLVCSDLPTPKNITLLTRNMNFVLEWDWTSDQDADCSDITFTAEYLAKFKITRPPKKQNWKSLCVATTERRCDFTSALLHYLGVWLLRVRAQCGYNVSSWVQIEFCPDRDALLGPPSAVSVTPVNGLLQVAITDPLSNTNGSMKEWLPRMYYLIQYWEKNSKTQTPNELKTSYNLVILPNLESWTWHCVRVQSRDDFYNKTSAFSPTYCAQTDGQTPYWKMFLFFLLSLVLSFLVVLGIYGWVHWLSKVAKNIFYPSVSLPTHIREYLFDSAASDAPQLLSAEPDVEICCERLEVLTTDPGVAEVTQVIMEDREPPDIFRQSGRMWSCHSSGDSGIYSTEEGSGLRQNGSGEVKMKKIAGMNESDELDERMQTVSV
ncbi:interleukin-10 receptor subunit beta [Trichomycterus rosablanca]|uniref:interleukin-10 receptor subunit beta n=1 Tax=Trichomycterus rosablanca TaxID=2290929 RepID=UPI002F352012